MSSITIRPANSSDQSAIAHLAALDSTSVPAGDLLVAEMCGRAVAAFDVTSGRAIADPFTPTADIVEMLELRAAPRRPRKHGAHALRFLPRAA